MDAIHLFCLAFLWANITHIGKEFTRRQLRMLNGGKDEEIDDSNKSCNSMCVLESSTLFGQCEGDGRGGENDESTDVRGHMKFISVTFTSDI